MQYTKSQINNNIRRALEDGRSNDEALDLYLRMCMENDLGPERPFTRKGPSPADVHMNLIGNEVIAKGDFKLEVTKKSNVPVQRLVVKLSPTCTLYAETSGWALQVTINNNFMTSIHLRSYWGKDVALWMIRQKRHLEQYMEGWDAVLGLACKKAKSNRIAFLGIRAMITEAMKDYPHVKYQIIEQKRRARIKVMIPNTNLGVYLDAWWGSFRERLPQQIESLKKILDVHRKSCLSNFFIYH